MPNFVERRETPKNAAERYLYLRAVRSPSAVIHDNNFPSCTTCKEVIRMKY
jgi:hypothetical protein